MKTHQTVYHVHKKLITNFRYFASEKFYWTNGQMSIPLFKSRANESINTSINPSGQISILLHKEIIPKGMQLINSYQICKESFNMQNLPKANYFKSWEISQLYT